MMPGKVIATMVGVTFVGCIVYGLAHDIAHWLNGRVLALTEKPDLSIATPEDKYEKYLCDSGMEWYSDFFKTRRDHPNRAELEDLFIRTYPALQELRFVEDFTNA